MDIVRSLLQEKGIPATVFDAHMAEHIMAAERMQMTIVVNRRKSRRFDDAGTMEYEHLTQEVRLVRDMRDPAAVVAVSYRRRAGVAQGQAPELEDEPWSTPVTARGMAVVTAFALQPLRSAYDSYNYVDHNMDVHVHFTFGDMTIETRLDLGGLDDSYAEDDYDDDIDEGEQDRDRPPHTRHRARVWVAAEEALIRQWDSMLYILSCNKC